MAVSNQLRGPSNKVGKTVPVPANLGYARFASPASGLTQQNIPAAIQLKSKTRKVTLAKG